MDKFFALFGKLVLVTSLLGTVAYGAFTFGKRTPTTQPSRGAASTTAAPTPTTDPGLKPESLPQGFIPRKTILAGLGPESGLSFTQYQMSVPEDWQVNHETTNEGTWVDTLILTKDFTPTGGMAQLKIFQAATGGALCLYPGDADFEGPSSRYDVFEDITTADGITLRRGTTKDTSTDYMAKPQGYSFCQKGSDGSFGQPTIFGHMSLTNILGSQALTEVDAMIASLKKR